MQVTKADMIISAVSPKQYPDTGLVEFALAGRSNVGISSFINRMIRRKSLARTSSKPGKTQTLNLYKIEEQLFFDDVPGYGYAKVSKKEREAWGKMIEQYLTQREQLKAVLLIVDVRHSPTEDDCLMYDFLVHYNIPAIVIATKADKISKGKLAKHVKIVKEQLDMRSSDPLIPFSSESGMGMEQAWKEIESYM